MWRPDIKNRAFDRMGERYAPIIDPDHFLGRSAFDIERPGTFPKANLKQKGKNGEIFELELAVPGFAKEEIEIQMQDDILTIRGKKSKPVAIEEEVHEFLIEEFAVDSFERTFRVAASVAHEKITAKYENGILKLTFIDVPKEEEKFFQTVKVQ